MPRSVVLEPAAEALEQEPRRAGVLDQLVDRLAVVRLQLARQQSVLTVDCEPAAELVDESVLADQTCVLGDRHTATARSEHDLDVRPKASFERARGEQREAAVGVAEQRPPTTEQRAVHVGVHAADRHRVSMITRAIHTGGMCWRKPLAEEGAW